MITSLDYTDNSLDENMDFDIQSSSHMEKFSLLNSSSLTTPPPEVASSPDSFTVYESSEKSATEPNPKPVQNLKRPRVSLALCNQKLLRTHLVLRDKLDKTYKRFKKINDNFQQRQIVKEKCNCDQKENQFCIFCKTVNVSCSNSWTPNKAGHVGEFKSTAMYINRAQAECQNLSNSNEDIDIKNMINILLECINKNSVKEVVEPYFYSNGSMLKGIEINRAELDDLENDFFLNGKKNKSKKSTCNKEVNKRGRSSFSRNNRRLSHLSESSSSSGFKGTRSRSARSNSTSSTRSSNNSINEGSPSVLHSDKFDINNIFIPNDIMSSQRITPLKNHKITTPKWREVFLESIDCLEINEEVLTEQEFVKRHEIPELKEKLNFTNKKKLTLFLNVDNLDEIKSILNKMSPCQVLYSPSPKSTIEWPERHFPLSDAEYNDMLKMDYFEFK